MDILQKAYGDKHKRLGRHPKLSKVEDMLLAVFEYWREYRTYAHITASYGVHENNIFRNIKWIEDILISDGTFSLPGENALIDNAADYEVVLLDATEPP